MCLANFCKSFFKNILSYTKCGLSKICSEHKYAGIPLTVFFRWQCNVSSLHAIGNRKDYFCLQLDGQVSRQPKGCHSAMLDPKGRAFRCVSGSLQNSLQSDNFWMRRMLSPGKRNNGGRHRVKLPCSNGSFYMANGHQIPCFYQTVWSILTLQMKISTKVLKNLVLFSN